MHKVRLLVEPVRGRPRGQALEQMGCPLRAKIVAEDVRAYHMFFMSTFPKPAHAYVAVPGGWLCCG